MAKMQTKGYFMPDNIVLDACNSTMKKFFCRTILLSQKRGCCTANKPLISGEVNREARRRISLSFQERWIAQRDGEVSVTSCQLS